MPADDPAVHTLSMPSQTGVLGMLDTTAGNAAQPAARPATPVTFTGGDDPQSATVDEATHTLYVANAGNRSDGSVTVIDDRACNARIQTGCSTTAQLDAPAGADPIAVDVDQATDTIYVAADAHAGSGIETFPETDVTIRDSAITR